MIHFKLLLEMLFFFSDKSSTSNMKIDALSFVSCLLRQHKPEVFYPHFPKLLPVSIKSYFSYLLLLATRFFYKKAREKASSSRLY